MTKNEIRADELTYIFIPSKPDFSFEKNADGLVAGIDEVGRGPWAGPVVAASLVFHCYDLPEVLISSINDSKKLTIKKRNQIFEQLSNGQFCSFAIGQASVEEIDAINIRQATFLAMQRSYSALELNVDLALVDGNALPKLPCKSLAIIGGDSISFSIAAASIMAKVFRDNLMTELGEEYPGYGWDTNAGYGTKSHQEGLARFGITPHHRKSFAPIRQLLDAA